MGTGLINPDGKIFKQTFYFRKIIIHIEDIFNVVETLSSRNYNLKSLRSDYLVIKDFTKLDKNMINDIRDEISIEYAKEIGLEFLNKEENYLILIINSYQVVVEISFRNDNEAQQLAKEIIEYFRVRTKFSFSNFYIYPSLSIAFILLLFLYPLSKFQSLITLILYVLLNLLLYFSKPKYVLIPTKQNQNNKKDIIDKALYNTHKSENSGVRFLIKIISSLIVGILATVIGGYLLNKLL